MWRTRFVIYLAIALYSYLIGASLAFFGQSPWWAGGVSVLAAMLIWTGGPVANFLPYGMAGVAVGIIGMVAGGAGLVSALLFPGPVSWWVVGVCFLSTAACLAVVYPMLILWSGPQS